MESKSFELHLSAADLWGSGGEEDAEQTGMCNGQPGPSSPAHTPQTLEHLLDKPEAVSSPKGKFFGNSSFTF